MYSLARFTARLNSSGAKLLPGISGSQSAVGTNGRSADRESFSTIASIDSIARA
jgi:hypothetical protein